MTRAWRPGRRVNVIRDNACLDHGTVDARCESCQAEVCLGCRPDALQDDGVVWCCPGRIAEW